MMDAKAFFQSNGHFQACSKSTISFCVDVKETVLSLFQKEGATKSTPEKSLFVGRLLWVGTRQTDLAHSPSVIPHSVKSLLRLHAPAFGNEDPRLLVLSKSAKYIVLQDDEKALSFFQWGEEEQQTYNSSWGNNKIKTTWEKRASFDAWNNHMKRLVRFTPYSSLSCCGPVVCGLWPWRVSPRRRLGEMHHDCC